MVLEFVARHPWFVALSVAVVYAVVALLCLFRAARRRASSPDGEDGKNRSLRLGRDGRDAALQEVRRLNHAYECLGDEHAEANRWVDELVAAAAARPGSARPRATKCRVVDAERRAALFPHTYLIPTPAERSSLRPGDWVRLTLADGGPEGGGRGDHVDGEGEGWEQERLWAVVVRRSGGAGGGAPAYEGVLVQRPAAIREERARVGDSVVFSARHVSRLGVRRGEHEAWYEPDAAVCLSKRALTAEGGAVRFAVALPPLETEGVHDSGWVLLCGGEDPQNPDDFLVVGASAAVTVCPAAEALFGRRAGVPDGTAFARGGEDEAFVVDEGR